MYPIHLLTGNMSLIGLLTATSPLTIRLRDPISSPCCPRRSATTTHSSRAKQQYLPGCETEPCHPGELPLWRWKEEDPLAEHFGGTHWEAFLKDSDLVQCIRQTYFRAHLPVFHKEVTYVLTDVFREMAEMAGLMDIEMHLVQDQWWSKKELCTANYVARGSAKDLHYFRVVSPLESPKIMGPKGIHSPEALKHQAGLSFCPWCRKEGQNECTMVNHLHTRHYHLGLI